MYKLFGNGLLMPQTGLRILFASIVCGQGLTQKYICLKGFLFLVSGSDPYLFDSVSTVCSLY